MGSECTAKMMSRWMEMYEFFRLYRSYPLCVLFTGRACEWGRSPAAPSAAMGEIEGTYRALQTPGTRLGSQLNPGISTLEPGQSLNASGAGGKGKCLQIRVQGLDDAQEFYELEVSLVFRLSLSCVDLPCVQTMQVSLRGTNCFWQYWKWIKFKKKTLSWVSEKFVLLN